MKCSLQQTKESKVEQNLRYTIYVTSGASVYTHDEIIARLTHINRHCNIPWAGKRRPLLPTFTHGLTKANKPAKQVITTQLYFLLAPLNWSIQLCISSHRQWRLNFLSMSREFLPSGSRYAQWSASPKLYIDSMVNRHYCMVRCYHPVPSLISFLHF